MFVPWRSEEEEIENVNYENKYNANINIIKLNRDKYCVIADEALDNALESVINDNETAQLEEIKEFDTILIPFQEQNIDILEQGGIAQIKDKNKYEKYIFPKRISESNLMNDMENLNAHQREFVMHVLNCFKTETLPLRISLSGSAGVGNTTTIKCVY